jgi:putative ABC transport system ATP-binding protein
MQLSLEKTLPAPLREKSAGRTSGIWQQQVSLARGEKIFVQAPSGTGKTTLVHMLYGLRSDYEGKVLWDSNEVRGVSSEQLAGIRAKKISIIFQDLRLFPGMTAWENLEIKRTLTNTVTAEEALQWLERLGLKDRRDKPAATLSYGERQRVAIIRALLQPFEWLLMDEPFSHLDKANIGIAAGLISEVLQRNNAGFLLADLDENHYFNYDKTLML